MASRAHETVATNQGLLEDAVKITPHRARVLAAPTLALTEESAAYDVYLERQNSRYSLGDDERSRSREHSHWLKAAQYRWLELPPSRRVLAYGNINFHRFLAFNFLKLSDLRWLCGELRAGNPEALVTEEWEMIDQLLEDQHTALVKIERSAMVINEADVIACFAAIEYALARCKT